MHTLRTDRVEKPTITNSRLAEAFKKQDLSMRKMFADMIFESRYDADNITCEDFHELLRLAKERNWIHPTQLAIATNQSTSNARKWFYNDERKSTPHHSSAQAHIVHTLAGLLLKDVARMEQGQEPENHKGAVTASSKNNSVERFLPNKYVIKETEHPAASSEVLTALLQSAG